MQLPSLKDIDLSGKKVILRADLDVDEKSESEILRLKCLLPTLQKLADDKAQIVIIGHKGRPDGKVVEELSLKPVADILSRLLEKEISFCPTIKDVNFQNGICLLENLRFDPREEGNDPGFAQELASMGEFYVNDAFASSHRAHASIVGIPKLLPHAAGFQFQKEVKALSAVFENTPRPVLSLIGGIKEDKLEYLEGFKDISDLVIIAGRLPDYLMLKGVEYKDPKIIVSNLNPDKEDITIHSIERIEEEIAKAKTIILAGPIGKYEDEGHRLGTERVLDALANSQARKIAAGGDTGKMLQFFHKESVFSFISTGGGAALEFLVKKTLPGIEALLN
jgi:3-phosphoglycerate kinase